MRNLMGDSLAKLLFNGCSGLSRPTRLRPSTLRQGVQMPMAGMVLKVQTWTNSCPTFNSLGLATYIRLFIPLVLDISAADGALLLLYFDYLFQPVLRRTSVLCLTKSYAPCTLVVSSNIRSCMFSSPSRHFMY
jgi:hypothetical protein